MAVSAAQKKQLLDAAASLQARGMAALAQTPAPLRRAVSDLGVRFVPYSGPSLSASRGMADDPKAIAGVQPGSPNTIRVMDERQFGSPGHMAQLAAHEAVHLVQNNLPPTLQKQIPADDPKDPYDYGGTENLQKLRAQGKTLIDLPREQQAAVVQYFQSQNEPYQEAVRQGVATKSDNEANQQLQKDYSPWINDLNRMPQSIIEPTAPTDDAINTTPRAPLPPPTDVLGTVQPAKEVYAKGDAAPGESKKKPVDISAGLVKKAEGYRGKGKVVAFDEATHLPVVRHPGTTVSVAAIEPKESAKPAAAASSSPTSNDVAKPEVKPAERKSAAATKSEPETNSAAKSDSKPEHETKYEFGSTQANIPETSDAHKAITEAQKKIPAEHLAGKGLDVDKPHVTLRYGIQGDDTSGVKKYLGSQKPFEAKLGKTKVFPPSKNSDGAAVVHAEVHSPDLHRMNAEIAKHGKFKESDFPDYKPHVTVAYVKPEVADKYKGMADAEGKSFKVTHVAISDKDGNHEEVPLSGKEDAAGAKPEDKQKKTGTGFGALNLTKGQTVHLNSGVRGSIQHVNTSMKIVRIKTHDGHNLTVRHSQIAAVEDGKNDRNRSAESAATT